MIYESTILLVEDDDNDVILMQRALKRARLANPLRIVRDGDQAIRYLAGEGEYSDRDQFPVPFLVLLDLKLPRRSGFEVLQWIREQPLYSELLVAVLTSSNQQPDVERANSLGADSYLMKPAQFEELVALVQRLQGFWLLVREKSEHMSLMID